jgi:hypothetical protein
LEEVGAFRHSTALTKIQDGCGPGSASPAVAGRFPLLRGHLPLLEALHGEVIEVS